MFMGQIISFSFVFFYCSSLKVNLYVLRLFLSNLFIIKCLDSTFCSLERDRDISKTLSSNTFLVTFL